MCIVRSRRVRHSHRTHLKCLAVFVRVVVVRVERERASCGGWRSPINRRNVRAGRLRRRRPGSPGGKPPTPNRAFRPCVPRIVYGPSGGRPIIHNHRLRPKSTLPPSFEGGNAAHKNAGPLWVRRAHMDRSPIFRAPGRSARQFSDGPSLALGPPVGPNLSKNTGPKMLAKNVGPKCWPKMLDQNVGPKCWTKMNPPQSPAPRVPIGRGARSWRV
jgi:hypothetical protein